MTTPAINMRRVYLIARRDFLGYAKTIGFWISMLSPFIGLLFGLLGSQISMNSEPVRYAAVLDNTGRYEGRIEAEILDRRERMAEGVLKGLARFQLNSAQKDALNAAMEDGGLEAGKAYLKSLNQSLPVDIPLPETKVRLVPLPAPDMDSLMPYIEGEQTLTVDGETQKLSGVLQFFDTEDGIASAKYWTISPSAPGLESYAEDVLEDDAKNAYFEGSGLTNEGYWAARNAVPEVGKFNPARTTDEGGSGQELTLIDRIPVLVAAGLAGLLWLTVFSGSYMLLMSMVEEKLNKGLEMLLATTRFTEIMAGKLLGVAALTLTTMAPWLAMGGVGVFYLLTFGDGAIGAAILEAISLKMLFAFLLFFIFGYVFYGALFMAIGSMSESLQDSQTLVTPIMLMLTMCVLTVPMGISAPDSQLLRIASFVPISSPFAMLIRLPSEPPLWEILLSGALLIGSALFVVWLSAKMFRYGVLSGGGMAGVKAWFNRVILRKKSAA